MYIKVKRMFDLILAFFSLILALPLMLIIAIAIKLDDPGPIIFKQERLGRNGKVFEIYKFRTMINNAISVGSGLRTEAGDSRITRVGTILRKTSLDELPQLLNVMKGEMSFIGPRPPVPYHPYIYENYSEEQRLRFTIRPGITGLAQVKYRNSATWDERIIEDIKYVRNIGLILDIKICLSTIGAVLLRKNIYPMKNETYNECKERGTTC